MQGQSLGLKFALHHSSAAQNHSDSVCPIRPQNRSPVRHLEHQIRHHGIIELAA